MFTLLLGICFSVHFYHNTVWFVHTLLQWRQMNYTYHRTRWPHALEKKEKKRDFYKGQDSALNSKLQSRTYVSPSDSAHCNLATNSYFIALHYKNHLYSLHTSWGQASHFLWCTGSLHSCMTKVRFIKRWDKEDGVFSFTFVGASGGSFALLIYFCISQISNEGEEAVQDWEI